MRILHTEASLGWGGQEIRILTESRAFLDRGHDVLLAADPSSDIFKHAPDYGVPVVPLPLLKKSARGLAAMRRLLRERRPDVVNVHSSVDAWLAALARTGLRPRPAIVRTRHISARVGRDLATRFVYRRGADLLVTTGRFIARGLVEDGFLPEDRVISVPTGIDLGRFRPGDRAEARAALGVSPSTRMFVIVATLRSWKGHDDLVEAFAAARGPGDELWIVGDGPRAELLRERIARLGITPSVRLTGRQDDVTPYLRAADLFVLPSYANEGVPQALLQALACGVPSLVSDLAPFAEVVERFPGVRTFPARDVPALARALAATPPAPPATSPPGVEALGTDAMYRAMLAVFERAAAGVAR